MKILQLGKAYPPVNLGGVEVVIQYFTEGLNEKNYSCDALGVNDKYKFVIDRAKNGGNIYRTKLIVKAFSTLFSLQLISFLNEIKNQYNVIHIHSPDPMAAIALFICRPSCKIVLHWHSDILRQKLLMIVYNPILKWVIKRADLILATSPNYIDNSKHLSKVKFKTKVLPIGLDIPKSTLSSDEMLTKKYRYKKIIFSLGRLAYYKGYEYLILSAKTLPNDYLIIIAGEGNQRAHLTQIIKKNDLGNKVLLIGKVSEAEKRWYFENCLIFALSSVYKTEAYAIVQIEAMAYAKPVVSTIIEGSGVHWVNKNNMSGITVPTKNPEALANAFKLIISNIELYDKYSKGALARYKENFSAEVMINKLISYYDTVLK